MSSACRVCGGGAVSPFFDVPRAPVFCNQLCHSREEALAVPMARIHLGHCGECDHVFNLAFEPERLAYSPEYENSLHCSGAFQKYANGLAGDLVQRYALQAKTVVEIGCGSGDFLRALCQGGRNRGLGFDPSYPGEPGVEDPDHRVTIHREHFDRSHAETGADLVCCRHCLEHIDEPMPFLRSLREALGDTETAVFFEVPNSLFTVRDGGIWDVIYEHCGYFSPGSLARAFVEAGFQVDEVATAYGGQFLTIHARSCTPASGEAPPELGRAADHLSSFADEHQRTVGGWDRDLEALAGQGKRAVVWGAGSKGVTFLNTVGAASTVEYVVDINPRKQGKFIAGTGQEIVAPGRLVDYRPDVVIVMNPIYADEIGRQVERLGVEAEQRSVS